VQSVQSAESMRCSEKQNSGGKTVNAAINILIKNLNK
jgi:hypothetical protein